MLKEKVIAHFGSQIAVARALNICKQAVSNWPEIVPQGSAYKLQFLTAGILHVDPTLYPKKIVKKKRRKARRGRARSKQSVPLSVDSVAA